MAAGVRYRVEFFDIFNKRVQVDFLTKDYAGDIKMLTASASPVSLAFKGDDDSTFQSLFTSQATIKVLAGIDDIDFFEDIATMEDDTFGIDMRVQYNVLNLWITEYQWNGWCVPDEQQRTFSYQEQEVTITAICPLSRAKGYSLLDEDGNYIHGKHTLSYYINRCIAPAFSTDNTIGSYIISVTNSMRLSHEPGDDTIPPTFDGIGVDAEIFNDDDGRPINAFDALNKIMTAFLCRCFYENRILYICDIPDLAEKMDIVEKNVTYKTAAGADIGSDLVLIKNSENITTIRSFKESNCTFKYNGISGLLLDGNMLDWSDESDDGHLLNQWQYNSLLSGQSDFTQRRVGNGRIENPYGFEVRRYTTSSFGEELGTTSDIEINSFDSFSLSVTCKENTITSYSNGSDPFNLKLVYKLILYNELNPAKSFMALAGGPDDNTPVWHNIDLTDTSYEDGVIDFSIPTGACLATLQVTPDIQSVSIDFPPVPIIPGDDPPYTPVLFKGKVFFVADAIDIEWDGSPPSNMDYVSTYIFSAIFSRNVTLPNNRRLTGEKVYITRNTKVSTQTQSREIELNTSANDSASGALVAMVDYTDYLGIERKTNSPLRANPGLSKDVSDLSWGNVLPLIKYNAAAVMRYNYNQLKIDIDAQGANCPFATPLNLSALYDSERPSTAIYNERFIQLNQTYDLKTCQRRMTIVSMKKNWRTLSTSAADDTHDLYEYYQTVQQ